MYVVSNRLPKRIRLLWIRWQNIVCSRDLLATGSARTKTAQSTSLRRSRAGFRWTIRVRRACCSGIRNGQQVLTPSFDAGHWSQERYSGGSEIAEPINVDVLQILSWRMDFVEYRPGQASTQGTRSSSPFKLLFYQAWKVCRAKPQAHWRRANARTRAIRGIEIRIIFPQKTQDVTSALRIHCNGQRPICLFF